MKKLLANFFFILFISVILVLSIRGIEGNPTSNTVNLEKWKDEGPFELSPERGRFALTLSIIENKSVEFSTSIAQFATPDLGLKNGKFVSLFAPLLSFLIIPGYWLGSIWGFAQVGVYATISIFALLNIILIRKISLKLGSHPVAANIAAALFLFGTPAFAYAVSLYQHHVSTFLLLLSVLLLHGSRSWLKLFLVWFLCSLSIPLDYPNLFMMLPIISVAIWQTVIFTKSQDKIHVGIRPVIFFAISGVVAPLVFFFWFNAASYGNPFTLISSLSQVKALTPQGKLIENTEKSDEVSTTRTRENRSTVGFFNSRLFLRGLGVLVVSPDRGFIFFAPIVLLGILGGIVLYRRRTSELPILLAVIGFNISLYSMWGDPWGGWAFGGRYLIPTFAIVSIFLSIALTRFRNNIFFMIIFLLVATYSIAVNTLGAITSNRNPPQVETVELEKLSGKHEPYTWERNINFLNANKSKSFFYNTFAYRWMNAWTYYQYITISIVVIIGLMLAFLSSKPLKHN
ncbi:MAG: hypothetical protein AAB874_00425 [Patescibacteria group bacterium]